MSEKRPRHEWSDDDDALADVTVDYDRTDTNSIHQARLALARRLGLSYLPTLCNEPQPPLVKRLWQRLRGRRAA